VQDEASPTRSSGSAKTENGVIGVATPKFARTLHDAYNSLAPRWQRRIDKVAESYGSP
jgi:hypothetical protein